MSGSTVAPLPAVEYRRMALTLRVGLLTSLAILVGGVVAFALEHPGLALGSVISSNPILGFLGVSGLVAGLAAGNPSAILTVGLLVLVATPILRVVTGFYFFRRGGERGMQRITLGVLALLLFGLLVMGPLIH